MLSNAYFLAKFRSDTAENEPAKNLQNFQRFANFANPNPLTLTLTENSSQRIGGGLDVSVAKVKTIYACLHPLAGL